MRESEDRMFEAVIKTVLGVQRAAGWGVRWTLQVSCERPNLQQVRAGKHAILKLEGCALKK
jgi:hypothetical protein